MLLNQFTVPDVRRGVPYSDRQSKEGAIASYQAWYKSNASSQALSLAKEA